MKRTLDLTFGPPRDVDVALGCAEGVHLRYEVRRVVRGCWRASIEVERKPWTVRDFTTRRAARQFCARDFHRRQILRAA